mgnify:CR=1 FL=1
MNICSDYYSINKFIWNYRKIIGTDVQSPDLIIESGSEIYLPRYYEGIDLIRQILFQTHDAEKIAYSNAAKILNLKG